MIFAVWQLCSDFGAVPGFMLPSPVSVIRAFISDAGLLARHSVVTLSEAFAGLFISLVSAFFFSFVMDRFSVIKKALYPILVITQTVPAVAIAPLLVLWFGIGMTPKIILVAAVCFFPMTVGLLDGYASADPDQINLLRAMGAGKGQIFRFVKLPGAMTEFFSSFRIAVSYCVVGAVIAEWLGGTDGLGVYMTRVRRSYGFDKMFAVILLISVISLILACLVRLLEKKTLKWRYAK